MNREIHGWWSPALNKHMDLAVYGHYGFALLMIPTAAADFLEYERFSLLEAIAGFINAGKVKVFSINTVNNESWFNDHVAPPHKAIRHQQFNDYVFNEVIPFIHSHCHGRVMTITCGASVGALHAANLLFKRPDLIDGMIAMSGVYDLKYYTKGYYDDNCYFNSPMDYLPGLSDDRYLSLLRAKHHIYILTGQGAYEAPDRSRDLAAVLAAKSIPHFLDVWGHDMSHDWPTWRRMLPHYLGTRF